MANDQLQITIYELRKLHSQSKQVIQKRLQEFTKVKPSEYFYELAYCLLTPQTKAESAGKAIEVLKKKIFSTTIYRLKQYYIAKIITFVFTTLKQNIFVH